MLSIEECRALLPDGDNMTDEDIAKLRDDMYGIARIAFDAWQEENKRNDKS